MTTTFQTASFALDSHLADTSLNLYQVEVVNFEGETEYLEVEAISFQEAADLAESNYDGDVYNMNIYLM